MPVQSAGNSLYFGDPFMSLKDYGLGILGGALTGGIGNGMVAALKGNNFWTGKDVKFGRTKLQEYREVIYQQKLQFRIK